MFRRANADNIEFSRRHMVAVRLVDAINFVAPNIIPEFKPILAGFRLKVTQEKAAPWHWNESFKLHIEPAGWPKGSVISCFLVQTDGWYALDQGDISIPNQGSYHLGGHDSASWVDYQPRETQLNVTIWPKKN